MNPEVFEPVITAGGGIIIAMLGFLTARQEGARRRATRAQEAASRVESALAPLDQTFVDDMRAFARHFRDWRITIDRRLVRLEDKLDHTATCDDVQAQIVETLAIYHPDGPPRPGKD